jgi:hexulose-6-phosphate isomerase
MNIGFMQGRLSKIQRGRIQSFPFENWAKEFSLAKKNGFNLIEWTIDSFNIDKNPILTTEGIAKIKLLRKINKIKIESITCDFFMENPFYKKKYNLNALEYLKKILINSKILKIKYIVLPVVDFSSVKKKSEKKKLIENIKAFEKFIPNNSKILFETDFKPRENLIFIKKFNSKKFGLNYDTGNSAHLGNSVKSEMRILYNYIDNIHIKDRKKNKSTIDLGEGDFDFDFFFKFILSKNYSKNLILQTARSKNKRHLDLLKKNRSFINSFINEFKT